MNTTFRFTSKAVIFFAAVWMVFQFFAIRRWLTEDLVWQHEMKSYYAYLPAAFILKDIGLEKTEMNSDNIHRYYYPQPGKLRGHVQKTTMGVSIMESPFFLAAHITALCGNTPRDGFDFPYRKAAMISAIFYALLGLFFTRKILLHFFSETVTILVLLTLVVGTNLYFYTLHDAAMSHAYSFAMIACFVYLTVSWHRVPSHWKLLLLGGVLGLITLIRPVNGSVAVFFLLYKDVSQITWKEKFTIFFSQWKHIIGAGLIFTLVLFPQLAYWKYLTDSWLFYSYGEEGFFWLRPKIWLGLFSYQKGWLVWTPVMWFAIVGILLLFKRYRGLVLPVFISLALYIYIVFCWWCWWYGGGFGMRPMIDIMAILAIPLGAFFTYVLRSKIFAYPILGVWVFLLALNIFQSRQYAIGKLHWAGTTKKVYWQMFLNDYPEHLYTDEDIREPDIAKAIKGESGLED